MVAKKEANEVAVVENSNQLPAFLHAELDQFSGLGNSSDPSDSSLPFLAIIQSNSPQLKEEDSKYISDSKAGYIFNTATRQHWPSRSTKVEEKGVLVIPCGFSKHWVEWKPNRGGYVATHPFSSATLKSLLAKKTKVVVEGKEREAITTPNGNILTETGYTFLNVDGMPMVLGASSTALGVMRDWMSYRRAQRLNGRELPSFSKKYRLRTALKQKDQNSWYLWTFADEGYVTDPAEYEQAKNFAIMVANNEVVVGRPDVFDEGYGESSGSSDGSTEDDGIPV